MFSRFQRVFPMFCLVQLLMICQGANVTALYRPPNGMAHYRNRLYTQVSIGPAFTFYTLHREMQKEIDGIDDKKKWFRFIGGTRNYDLAIAYVFDNGLILGGDLALMRSYGMKGLSGMNKLTSPDNPGGMFSAMLGPVIGFYPRLTSGWYVQAQPSLGYSTFSSDAPTGSLRLLTGMEWPAGPLGAFGLNLAAELQWTKSEDEGYISVIKYDSVHLPIIVMLNIAFKGFWKRN